jgi:hypothetical protein
MADPSAIAEVIDHTLRHFPLAPAYASEQRDLQPHVQAEIEKSLRRTFPELGLVTTISVGGNGKPSLKLLGTSYWPDVEIADGNEGLVAIEVKLIRPRQATSKAMAEAVGQALIYSVRYPRVFAFILNYGRSDNNLHDEDTGLTDRLLSLSIGLILRAPASGEDPVLH